MYTQTFQIEGYQPAWAPEQKGKQSNQVVVLDGMNFFWNLRGVQSGFGRGWEATEALPAARHPSIQWVQNRPLLFVDNAVYEPQADGSLVQLFSWNASGSHPTHDLGGYKWTYAYVGTRHWFAHPLAEALVYYDEFDDEWGLFRDPCWNGPIYATTHSDNRLVVLLEDTVVWSKFDEGDKFDCGWQCGAGAQSLALIRYGQPYSVMPYNTGWLTFTSKGIMLSTPTQQQNMDPDESRIHPGLLVFNHEEVSFDDMPLGPTAITHVDERQVIWLATAGFMQFTATQGGGFGAVQPFAIEMGRFYKETAIPHALRRDSRIDDFCIDYARDMKWLFVSSRASFDLPYSRAHVYQFQIERWGSFNREHFCIGFGRVQDEIESQRNHLRHFGIVDEAGVYTHIDPMQKDAAAWVRFAPTRLQLPNEDLSAQTVSSVQGLRVGVAHASFDHTPIGGLQSSWLAEDDFEEIADSNFDLLIAGADDDATRLPDEVVYASVVRRHRNVIDYACHTTGVNHTVLVLAERPNEHFDIRHLEYTFFWAGVK